MSATEPIHPATWPDRGFVYNDDPGRWWAECGPCLSARFLNGSPDPMPDAFDSAEEAITALRQHLGDIHYVLCGCSGGCPECNEVGFLRRVAA